MFTIGKWKKGRFWALYDMSGTLICLCVYKKGAVALKARLEGKNAHR